MASVQLKFLDFGNDLSDADYLNRRVYGRTYLSRSFPLKWGSDAGEPSRYVYRLLQESMDLDQPCPPACDCEEILLHTSEYGRSQLRAHVAVEAGRVRKLRIQRIKRLKSGAETVENSVILEEEGAANLIAGLQALGFVSPDGDIAGRLDDDMLQQLLGDPMAISQVLMAGGEDLVRQVVESDMDARDVIAIAARQEAVRQFEQMLEDDDYFDSLVPKGSGAERVWQDFFEENPWILGAHISPLFLHSYSSEKLEQTVRGWSMVADGKRVDALLETSGIIKSLVFAEIKHHRTELLAKTHYRSGCWSVGSEIQGGVAQLHRTVHAASREIGETLRRRDDDGAELPDPTFLAQPQSFLIAGNLKQLHGTSGNVIPEKYQSFEFFRRNLWQPQVITFDELLARARWTVSLLEKATAGDDGEWD